MPISGAYDNGYDNGYDNDIDYHKFGGGGGGGGGSSIGGGGAGAVQSRKTDRGGRSWNRDNR